MNDINKKEAYVISKSPYILSQKELLSNIGISIPKNINRNLSFECSGKSVFLVNTVDVYETCKMLKGKYYDVYGLGGSDYLTDQCAKINKLNFFPFENDTFLVYLGKKNSELICTKFSGLAEQAIIDYDLKSISCIKKILGAEEIFLKMGHGIIASITSGKSLNQNLDLMLDNPSIDDVLNELKNKDYIAHKIMKCETVFFQMPN